MMQTFLQASRDNQNVQETQAILKNENQGSIIATKVIDQEKEVQANKSIRWMPWHQEPMKDVTSCDKLRLAANKLTRRFPNVETLTVKNRETLTESIG